MNKNLLILGAGGHGRVVKEVAEAMGIFDEIDFLDDNPKCEVAIGTLNEIEKFTGVYNYAFPAFGDSNLRMNWMEKLEEYSFTIPVLIHPKAYISPSATVHPGTVVLANAMINTNSIIEKGCILSIGSIVDHDSFIGYGCHIDCGAIIKANCIVKAKIRVESGKVITRNDLPTQQELLVASGFSFEEGV